MLIKYGNGLNYNINYDLMKTSICDANFKNYFILNPDLTIFKCTMLFNHPNNQIGYLNDKGDMIIDKVKHSKWLLKESTSKKTDCSICKLLPSCHDSTCPANKVCLEKKNNCGYELTNIKEIINLFLVNQDKEKYNFIKFY